MLRRALLLTSLLALMSVLPAHAGTPQRAIVIDGKPCPLAPTTRTANPVGTPVGCGGVRPGAYVSAPVGGCTLNFLFIDPVPNWYIGTAGHCVIDVEKEYGVERAWAPGAGPEAKDSEGRVFGRFVYARLDDKFDFSLIRINPGVTASPQMCHFGGPIGINTDRGYGTTQIHWYGHGLVYGTPLVTILGVPALGSVFIGGNVPARTALAPDLKDPNVAMAFGADLYGDSGAGAISSDGRAFGVVVTLGPVDLGGVHGTVGTVGLTRLGPQIARAGQVLGTPFTLQHAPLL